MFRPKVLFNVAVFVSIVLAFFYLFSLSDGTKFHKFSPSMKTIEKQTVNRTSEYNVWLIFTKVMNKSPLMHNFNNLLKNMLNVSSISLKLNIIVDDKSKIIAAEQLGKLSDLKVQYTFHNMSIFADAIEDIVDAMTPYFSSRPGTYYSDALFYVSLGLFRIAPESQETAVMLDCDVLFKDDILKLFQQFQRFEEGNLFGLAPELSPVYKHILYGYKQKHNTTFGEYYHPNKISEETVHPRGFQGYNSGVILFNLSAIRNSVEYRKVLKKDSVESMVNKYNFRGHLGDQDFYTLLGYEHPHMIRTLNCGYNRQLCTWWREKGGYRDTFHNYFQCNHKTVVLHGNCNTKITL